MIAILRAKLIRYTLLCAALLAGLGMLTIPAQAQTQDSVFAPAITTLGFLVPGQQGVNGEQLEWVITVNNMGDAAGTNVVITDTLRDELRIDRVDTPNGAVSINGQTVTLRLASLAPGESLQFSIFTTVLEDAQIDNTACINADNLAAQECVSAVAIRSLPATGETPWWRLWAVIGAFASVGLAILSIGMLMMLDMALKAPELEPAVIPVMDVEHRQG